MTAWLRCKSCNCKCSFLYFVLKSLQLKPCCFLAAFDMGRLDLADLFVSICIGECKLFDNGVLQYTIRHLAKVFSILIGLIEQVLYKLYIFFS